MQEDTTPMQRAMCNLAASAPARRIEAFLEIMEGSNPLTDSEIRVLAEKRPEYAFMKLYLRGP